MSTNFFIEGWNERVYRVLLKNLLILRLDKINDKSPINI